MDESVKPKVWMKKTPRIDGFGCICDRPSLLIVCRVCGYTTKGRLRKICSIHPMITYLMDFEQCPKCKTYSFMMEETTFLI